MRKAISIFLMLSAIAFVAVRISGCTKKAKAKPVAVGYIPFNNCLPFFVGVEKGYFVKRGLDVTPVRFNNSTDALNSLIGGQIDALAGITFSSYWAVEQEDPGRIKLFLVHYETQDEPFSYLLVPSSSKITDLAGLKHRKVGTYTGVSQLLYLRLFLKKIGLEPEKDVTVIQVGAELQNQALASGQLDALFTVEPYGTIAILKGIGKVLVASPRTRYIQDPFWGGAAAVMTQYLKENKDAVSALYDGMAEGVRFLRDSTVIAKSFLPKYTPMDSAVAQQSGIYKWVLLGERVELAGLQDLADVMTSEGVLRKKVDAIGMLLKQEDLK